MSEQPNPNLDDHIQNIEDQATAALNTVQELKRQQLAALGSIPSWTNQALIFSGLSWLIIVFGLCGSLVTMGFSMLVIILTPFSAAYGVFRAVGVLSAKHMDGIAPYRAKATIALILAVIPLAIIVVSIIFNLLSQGASFLWQK